MLTSGFGNYVYNSLKDYITNTPTYVFAARTEPWANASPSDEDNGDETKFAIKNTMLFGKKVKSADVANLIRRVTWTTGTVYAKYDDKDKTLKEKNYYVINTLNRVYKCISNNKGAVSTVEPTSQSNSTFKLADGYVWKYMFTIDSGNMLKFGTNDYVPVLNDSNVVSTSIPGAIEFIEIENAGTNWTLQLTGTILSEVDLNTFKIGNATSVVNNYYVGCNMYISSGIGAGALVEVEQYFANTSGTYVSLNTNTDLNITTNDAFIISPKITIKGNGSNAKAYCLVNTNSGSISSINIINVGSNYTFANVSISANVVVSGSNAAFRPIIQLDGGHGSNPATELFSDRLIISTDIANNESNTIYTNITYHTIGLVTDVRTYSNTNAVYSANTFNAITVSNYNSKSGTFNVNDTLVDANSTISAKLVFSNSSHIGLTGISAPLATGMILTNANTGGVLIIGNNINNSNINISKGNILHFDNINGIARSNTSTENIKIIIKLQE